MTYIDKTALARNLTVPILSPASVMIEGCLGLSARLARRASVWLNLPVGRKMLCGDSIRHGPCCLPDEPLRHVLPDDLLALMVERAVASSKIKPLDLSQWHAQ
jgi:hypothetical protein